MLSGLGFTAVEAGSAEEAVWVLQRDHEVDVVITGKSEPSRRLLPIETMPQPLPALGSYAARHGVLCSEYLAKGFSTPFPSRATICQTIPSLRNRQWFTNASSGYW